MVAIEHHQKSSSSASTSSSSTNANNINNNNNNNNNNNTTTSSAVVTVLSPISISSTASVSSSASATTTTSSIIQHHPHPQYSEENEQNDKKPKQQQQQPEQVQEQEHSQESSSSASSHKRQSIKIAVKTVKMSAVDQSSESVELAKRHQVAAAAAITKSAVSQRNVDIKIDKKTTPGDATTVELSKKVLKLDLTAQELDEFSLKSPKSPITARLTHQTSLTSSVDVEDRKTLREALYQGIFHRHRRTIFAVGSFLRMLRSRNSQYNTIRSSSEGEEVDEVVR